MIPVALKCGYVGSATDYHAFSEAFYGGKYIKVGLAQKLSCELKNRCF
jgi:hypothetical protein